jgi:transposase
LDPLSFITKPSLPRVVNILKRASTSGNIRVVKRIIAISAYGEGKNIATIASTLKICVQSVRNWIKSFILNRFDSLELGKSSGRASKLTKTQRKELSRLRTDLLQLDFLGEYGEAR